MDKFNYKLASSDRELKSALKVRRQVFVEEQGIPQDLESDEYDREAMHMIVKNKKKVIGTARIRFMPAGQAKLERMAVLIDFRGRGIGRGIISFIIEELRIRQKRQVLLHAQCPAVNFYKSCGFEVSGLPFLEAGRKHVKMLRSI